MSSHAFGAFIDVESSSRSHHSVPQTQGPDAMELENIQWGKKLNGPRVFESPLGTGYTTPTGYQTPRTPNDLEISRPPSPIHNEEDGVYAMQSFSSPPMNRFRMLSVCLMNFANGLSDSAPGALIPYVEKYAHTRTPGSGIC
jgi:hypothetical protein